MYTRFFEVFFEIKSNDDVEIRIQPCVKSLGCDVAHWSCDNIDYWRVIVHDDLVGVLLYNFKRIGFKGVAGFTNEFRHLSSSKFILRLFELKSPMGNESQLAMNYVRVNRIEDMDTFVVSIKPVACSDLDTYVRVNDSLLSWIFQIGVDEWFSIVNTHFNELDETDVVAFEKFVYNTYLSKKPVKNRD